MGKQRPMALVQQFFCEIAEVFRALGFSGEGIVDSIPEKRYNSLD